MIERFALFSLVTKVAVESEPRHEKVVQNSWSLLLVWSQNKTAVWSLALGLLSWGQCYVGGVDNIRKMGLPAFSPAQNNALGIHDWP